MNQFKSKSIAVIGAGISGLSAAWLLDKRHSVTLYEAADRIGGHCNTVLAPDPNGPVPVDTGFIVYNELTYPNLTALFRHLAVPTKASDMSFSVSLRSGQLQYSGSGLGGLFAQKSNLFRPRFISMLRDLIHFYRHSPAALPSLDATLTLGEFLETRRYGEALRDDHLLPMAGAIWSAEPAKLVDYPARAFIEFFVNHQLLNLAARVTWRTVAGGSRAYVNELTRGFRGTIWTDADIVRLDRNDERVLIQDRRHGVRRYDAVIIATHADQALDLLSDPSPEERSLLGAFRYSRNQAILHGDERLMPERRRIWSSWNVIGLDTVATGSSCVTYWMNRLQGFSTAKPLFVTLNPVRAPHEVFHEETYHHPLFDRAAVNAQQKLWSLQGRRNTWYCGSYFGAGFHEDGLQAGLAVAEALGGEKRPWRVPNQSDRIRLGTTQAVASSLSSAA